MNNSQADAKEEVELIPLDVLLGNPDKVSPGISPNGEYLTYLAPYNGVMNIWLRTVGSDKDSPITRDEGRGIRGYFWAYNGEQVLYVQDKDGDENWRIYAVDIESEEVRLLTPVESEAGHPIQAQIMEGIPERPDEVIIGLNARDPRIHDIYLLNTRTGDMEIVQESELGILGWLVDHSMTVRGYVQMDDTGGATIFIRDGGEGEFRELYTVHSEDMLTTRSVGFTPDNQGLYLIDSRDRNSSALVERDIATREMKVLAEDPLYDVSGVLMHPTEHTIQAVAFTKERTAWQVLDENVKDDFKGLLDPDKGDFGITGRTLADDRWLVYYLPDDGPVSYYSYDRESRDLRFLFHHREALKDMPLVEMRPIQFTARDGLVIHGYLSLPRNWEGPGPMVLNVHGGPWGRNSWGFNPEAQWLANRGYTCLQVNFRGSTGYGKDFLNAADREWGGKMQDDLTDAVLWAIEEGIAKKDAVVIYGGSYGGYATLAGVTFTPDLYAAGISIVGPSNLETFLNTIPPYWESFRKVLDVRVGRIPRYGEGEQAGLPKVEEDWTDEERAEIEFLHSRSPLFSVDNVKVPMLIAQGANDPRVKQAESDQFVEAMRASGLDVEYIIYEDEGHGFARPENRLDFYHRSDKFLAKILGGRYEE